jgi:hypothetical protein
MRSDQAIARLEAALTRLGHAEEPPRGWDDRVLAAVAQRRPCRYDSWQLAVLALGAGLVGAASRGAPDDLALVVTCEPRGPRVRSDTARVGDLLHITAAGDRAPRTIWVYRNEIELVATCPGTAVCERGRDRTTATLELAALGRYTVVALTSATALPVPRGSYDADLAAASTAGATVRVHEVIVR